MSEIHSQPPRDEKEGRIPQLIDRISQQITEIFSEAVPG